MRSFRSALPLIGLSAALAFGATALAGSQHDTGSEHGRYLVVIGGCNDCHTPGYPEQGGKVPTAEWLTGSPVGFQGPWGTTYPSNLRLLAQEMTEGQWIARARQPMRPPMPWPSLAAMSDSDLRSVYRFIRGLGADGEPAPSYAAPGVQVNTPYFDFVPKNLPQQQASR